MAWCFHLVVLAFAPEPAGTDGHVGLGRDPVGALGVALVQVILPSGVVSGLHVGRYDHAPVGPAGESRFVADPATAGAAVTEDDGLRVVLEDRGIEKRPVVYLLLSVGTLAVGPVEPLLENGPVGTVMHAF